MGTHYVVQKPYDMAQTYDETSSGTPMFFVLFPGVDPTPWVENLARTLDITSENGEATCTISEELVILFRPWVLFPEIQRRPINSSSNFHFPPFPTLSFLLLSLQGSSSTYLWVKARKSRQKE